MASVTSKAECIRCFLIPSGGGGGAVAYGGPTPNGIISFKIRVAGAEGQWPP